MLRLDPLVPTCYYFALHRLTGRLSIFQVMESDSRITSRSVGSVICNEGSFEDIAIGSKESCQVFDSLFVMEILDYDSAQRTRGMGTVPTDPCEQSVTTLAVHPFVDVLVSIMCPLIPSMDRTLRIRTRKEGVNTE